MLINKDDLKKEEINSRIHKVRAVIQDDKGKIYVTNMDNSYNLPGGRVEAKEEAKDALIRELAEELGIQVLDSEAARLKAGVEQTVFDEIFEEINTDNFTIFENMDLQFLRSEVTIEYYPDGYSDLV